MDERLRDPGWTTVRRVGHDAVVNGYDLIVVLLLALLAFRGWRRGLVGELIGLGAFVAGLALAYRFERPLGGGLARLVPGLTPTEARLVAFVATIVVVSVAAGYLARLLGGFVAHIPLAGAVNRLGGLLLGTALALVAIWVVTSALLLVPSWLVPYSADVHHSTTAHLVTTVAPRWNRDLRAHLDSVTASRLDPTPQSGLNASLVGQALASPRP